MALNAPSGYNPWQGAIRSYVTTRAELYYRVCGGRADPIGRWLTLNRPSSGSAAREELALPPENAATQCTEVWVPKGTRVQVGVAAPNFGQPGGGQQVELLERIPVACYGTPQPLRP